MEEFNLCDLCELNRATLHLDEVTEGEIRATAHLCDDCWFRLGIRIPLGNIWRHIRQAKEDPLPPLDPEEAVALFEDDDEEESSTPFDDLMNPSSLAIAEPGEDTGPDDLGLGKSIMPQDSSTNRLDRLDLDPLQPPDPPETPRDRGRKHGMDAVHVGQVHPSLVSLFPRDLLIRCKSIPIRLEGKTLTVAICDPFDKLSIANIEMYVEELELGITFAIADEIEILRELDRHGGPPRRFDSLS